MAVSGKIMKKKINQPIVKKKKGDTPSMINLIRIVINEDLKWLTNTRKRKIGKPVLYTNQINHSTTSQKDLTLHNLHNLQLLHGNLVMNTQPHCLSIDRKLCIHQV